MKELCDFVYGIVGLGLMGGSLGKAIREQVLSAPQATGTIVGTDINSASLERAKSEGVCDRTFLQSEIPSMLSQCDFVYICLYPQATVDFLRTYRPYFKAGAIVSDISGVKELIFEHLADIVRDDVDFIPGHPMAGGEKEGYEHSSGGIFANHNYIVMPLPQNRAHNITLFKELIKKLGFSKIVETDARDHDKKIAFTSQLCHIIASALVNAAENENIVAFGGGSFEDLTRIAMINAPLWTELFLANRTELLAQIEQFDASLSKLTHLLKEKDAPAIQSYLEAVRQKRIAMAQQHSSGAGKP